MNRLHSNIAISMLVLALDTTTRTGSLALTREGVPLEVHVGDANLAHGQRLPGDILRLLGRHNLTFSDIDLYAVAAGPGSMTGLRIGIATMQGLALVNGRGLAAVSALDALAVVAGPDDRAPSERGQLPWIGAWIDAHRGQIFTALYRGGVLFDGPALETPAATLTRWSELRQGAPITFVGDGAFEYADTIRTALAGDGRIVEPLPPLAPAIAQLAEVAALAGAPMSPGAVLPLYLRRSYADLARDRAKG